MADPILNSSSASAFNSILSGVATNTNVFDYKFAQSTEGVSMETVSRSVVEVQPQNTPAFNTQISIPIPKNGILQSVFIKQKVTNSSGSSINLSAAHGVAQVHRIDLVTSGRLLSSMTTEGLLCEIQAQPKNARDSLAKLCNILGQTGVIALADGASRVSYIPLMMSGIGGAFQNLYDTNFTANLELRLHVGAANAHSSAALSSIALSAYCTFVREPAAMQQKRIQNSFSDQSLQRIQYNMDQEVATKTLSASDRTITLELKNNNVLTRMWFYVEDETDVTTKFKGIALDTCKFTCNGQTIFDFGNGEDAQLLLNSGASSPDKWFFGYSNGHDVATDPLANRYLWNWGLTMDNTKVLSANAFRELSNATITVKIPGSTTTSHKLVCVYEYLVVESIEASSGKVTTSISS